MWIDKRFRICYSYGDMNLQYLKYAVEVANSGSINKAAEKLYMDQSNLSRCIKELESSLGVNIFERSSRGVKISPQGEEFLKYAKNILKQVDTLENMFRSDFAEKKKFSISVPRASYVGEAFFADERRIRSFLQRNKRSPRRKEHSRSGLPSGYNPLCRTLRRVL